ncbi:MAG: hypothetical protein CMK32_01740 [Porticoccaceae bacterium]|nr:hypothetical protein [Porticoccaceae bacterium]
MGDKKKKVVNKKDGQFIIRISKEERKAFIELCESLDTSAAREIRHFIRAFIARHNPDEAPAKPEAEGEQART